METLKFETLAQVGDVIKAFDFEGRPEFVLGLVTRKGFIAPFAPYAAYEIECIYDSRDHEQNARSKNSRKGRTVFVPFEMSMDYDNRVTKV